MSYRTQMLQALQPQAPKRTKPRAIEAYSMKPNHPTSKILKILKPRTPNPQPKGMGPSPRHALRT